MAKFKRKRLFVDRSVQGAFMLRTAFHWLMCVLSLCAVETSINMLIEPVRLIFPNANGPWLRVAPAVVTTFLLLPLIVYDTIKLTHRLVGPLLRLRTAMRLLAAGENVEPIRFRDGDFWQGFADEFNLLAERVQRSAPTAETAPASLAT